MGCGAPGWAPGLWRTAMAPATRHKWGWAAGRAPLSVPACWETWFLRVGGCPGGEGTGWSGGMEGKGRGRGTEWSLGAQSGGSGYHRRFIPNPKPSQHPASISAVPSQHPSSNLPGKHGKGGTGQGKGFGWIGRKEQAGTTHQPSGSMHTTYRRGRSPPTVHTPPTGAVAIDTQSPGSPEVTSPSLGEVQSPAVTQRGKRQWQM